jgi:hypothetical protein
MHHAHMAKSADKVAERAARLVQAREAKGIETAAEAARRIRVKYPTYKNHEDGHRGFSTSARRYADFYGVRLLWLLEGDGSMLAGEKTPEQELFDEVSQAGHRDEVLRYLRFLLSQRE